MGTNFTNGSVDYWIEIPIKYKDYLGGIRHWENVKVAQDDKLIYLKDLLHTQVRSEEIYAIPFAQLYYLSDNYLFRINTQVPEKRPKTSLLWTPIARTLSVSIANENFNYFGIEEKLSIQLVATSNEEPAFASLVSLKELGKYLFKSSSVRLNKLKWLIIGDKALIVGTPLLPIPGETFCLDGNSLIPHGFKFEFSSLAKVVANKLVNDGSRYIYWTETGKYSLLDMSSFQDLSISSFKKTRKVL